MSLNSIIHRKLSWGGCRFVGTQLAQRIAELSAQNITLAPGVIASAQNVALKTQALDQLSGGLESGRKVDNFADQFLSAYYNSITAREDCYLAETILPLSTEDKQQLERLQRVRQALFPNGVAWINQNFIEQWNRMFEIQQKLLKEPLQKDLAQLGLSAETSRLQRWIERYGKAIKPGAGPADLVTQLTYDFHVAWEDFTIEVRYTYKTEPELRQKLLEVFDTQLAREQEIDRIARQRAQDNDDPEAPITLPDNATE